VDEEIVEHKRLSLVHKSVHVLPDCMLVSGQSVCGISTLSVSPKLRDVRKRLGRVFHEAAWKK
jgi:hypothetical protein